jgi:putative hemolysin
MEIAFLSSSKLKIELRKKQGSSSGTILSRFLQNKSMFLGTTLIGFNMALVIFSTLLAKWIENNINVSIPGYLNSEFLVLLIQTVFTTAIVLVAGEFIPKTIFRINPNGMLVFFALPFLALYYVLFPLVWLVVFLSKQLLKLLFQVNVEENKPVFAKIDLEHFIKQNTEQLSDDDENAIDTDLFDKALYLTNVKIKSCMVPRTEIEAVDINEPVNELNNKFIETKLSRLIIYEDSLDNVNGYVHHLDLFKSPISIREIIKEIPVAPESMPARNLMYKLMRERKSIALVVDEYGGTSGIVTLEDVLEEIFGEIRDEHDTEELPEKKVGENEYIFSGRLEIDYINDKYNLKIPIGDYATLSGYVIHEFENIPPVREKIITPNLEMEVLQVSTKRVESVRVKEVKD